MASAPWALTIVADADELPAPEVDGQGHRARSPHVLTLAEVLAEPQPCSGEWVAAVVRRLEVMHRRPVAVLPPDPPPAVVLAPGWTRLRAAGIFVGAPDADLETARTAAWPAAPVLDRLGGSCGSAAPRLVVVGDAPRRAGQRPFASRSGTWLFAALRLLGVDELTVLATNARDHRGKRRDRRLAATLDAVARAEPFVLAVGREAEAALRRLGCPHGHAPHPAHHRRWHHADGVAGYAELLARAGVPRAQALEAGPWAVDRLPDLPEPFAVRSVAYRRGESAPATRTRTPHRRTADPAVVEAARRLYVTGEARTPTAAAETLNLHPSAVQDVARAQDWAAERADHARTLTERAKQAAEEAEARSWSTARRLAWAAVEQALGSNLRRLTGRQLRDGEDRLVPSPRETEALCRVALALSQANVTADDAERDRLAQLPIGELAREVAVIAEQLGGPSPSNES